MRSLGLEIKSPNVEGTSDKAGEAAVGIGAEVVKGKEGDTINDEGVVDLAFESKLNSIPTHLDHGHRQSPIAERTTAGSQARSGDGGRHEPRISRDVGVQTDLLEDDLHQTQLRSRERELEEMKVECARFVVVFCTRVGISTDVFFFVVHRLRDTERVLRARIEEYELKEAQVEDKVRLFLLSCRW
ncbi:hypothetical protein CPC08DRAFT_150545 [Agrocybe pediades]|nr:hypothetical protein CPC08DRAFT_150545 [Agrocybe pediades]